MENKLTLLEKYHILKHNYTFLNDKKDSLKNESNEKKNSIEEKYLKEYNKNLFREFVLGDFSEYKKGKIGLKWCNKSEIIEGKGYKICGNINCNKNKRLKSYEINFNYKENNKFNSSLVKIYLCHHCSKKLKKSFEINNKQNINK